MSEEDWKFLDLELESVEKESVESDEYSVDSQDDDDGFGLPTKKKRRVVDALPESKVLTRAPLASADRMKDGGYHVIDEEDLFQEQRQLVLEVAQVLELPLSYVAVMLRHYAWSKEKLLEACLDSQRVRAEAGLEFAGNLPPVFDPFVLFDCSICYEAYPGDEVFGMGCSHVFCKDCWRLYLSVKIAEGPVRVSTATCPSQGCDEAVLDETFKQFTSNEDYVKYVRFMLRSYVDINKNIKWCPAPGCTKAICSVGVGLRSVACTCGCKFCFRCGEEAHEPVSCEQLEAWQEMCRNESETVNWILTNTKKCRECWVRIEKNEGCNHVRCESCGHEFCWVCLEPWTKHDFVADGYDDCRLPDLEKVVIESDVELDPYLQYYQRYTKQSRALVLAKHMRNSTESRLLEPQESHEDSSRIDLHLLNTATEQLIECQRVLKYTHVFGYNLDPGKEKSLFEYLQDMLERNVERLTDMLMKPLDEMNCFDIMNYTRATGTFMHNLLAGIEDGLTADNAIPLE